MSTTQHLPKPVTEHWPLERFKPDPKELARHDDPEKVRLMGEDLLANGQLHPPHATEDGRMISGHGRYLAAKSAGIKALEVKAYPASLTDNQFMLIRASENLQRKELNGFQRWMLCAGLMSGNPTWSQQDLCRHLHQEPSTICRYLSPSRCTPEWQEALRLGKVGIGDCYAASKLTTPEAMAGLLALKLNGGATRDQMEAASRRARTAQTPAVKVGKIRCDLPGGVCVTVSGEGVSLEDGVESLGKAMAAMKKAMADGFTAKTFAAAMKDKSRKA